MRPAGEQEPSLSPHPRSSQHRPTRTNSFARIQAWEQAVQIWPVHVEIAFSDATFHIGRLWSPIPAGRLLSLGFPSTPLHTCLVLCAKNNQFRSKRKNRTWHLLLDSE